MNVRRGLFRAWLVLALLVFGITMSSSYHEIRSEFEKAATAAKFAKISVLLIPVLCKDARGERQKDYNHDIGKVSSDNVFNQFDNCWYEVTKYRSLYPENNKLTDDELTEKLYQTAGIPTSKARPWALLFNELLQAFLPLAALLLAGWAALWVFAGFRNKGMCHEPD